MGNINVVKVSRQANYQVVHSTPKGVVRKSKPCKLTPKNFTNFICKFFRGVPFPTLPLVIAKTKTQTKTQRNNEVYLDAVYLSLFLQS